MKTKLNLSVFILLLGGLLFLSNCKEKAAIDPTIESDIELGAEITHSVAGLVSDENGNPIAGAKVYILAEESETNEDGVFELFNVNTNENHAYIKVEKSGYFLGSRSYIPLEGINMVEIKLISQPKIGEFQSSAGGVITFNDASIEMGAGYVTESGAEYSGNVNVFAAYLDPISEDISLTMPGSLRATSDERETLLSTFGIIGVELKDDNGNELQLAESSSAQLTMPIPASMLASAPATIPLWHFDEVLGYWIEEGSATKVDGKYVGTVEHFTFWNAGLPGPSTFLNGKVLSSNGLPLSFVRIGLISSEGHGQMHSYTNANGEFEGYVPSNVEFYVVISKGNLGLGVYNTTIGPFTSAIVTNDITVPSLKLVKAIGKIKDCAGNLADGYVKLTEGIYARSVNSDFEIYFLENSEIDISVFDNSKNFFNTRRVTVGTSTLNLGDFLLCQSVQGIWRSGEYGLGKYSIDSNRIEVRSYGVYEDTLNNEVRFRFGKSNGATGVKAESFLTFDIPSGYNGPGTYKLTHTNGNGFTIDTHKPSNGTLVAYDIDLEIEYIDVKDQGGTKINFSGTVTQFNTATNQNETYQVSEAEVGWQFF